MCYHRLYIYDTCGHSFFSNIPLSVCRHASISPFASFSKTCDIRAHPFQSVKLEKLCAQCQRQRDMLLTAVEQDQIVRFEEWRWKVSYRSPAAAQNGWLSWARNEGNSGAVEAKRKVKTRSGRWTWRRSKTKSLRQPPAPLAAAESEGLGSLGQTSDDGLRASSTANDAPLNYQRAIFQASLPLPARQPSPETFSADMPTPESASFRAAKPTVPPTFDGVDYDDNKALKAAQDAILREQWVQSMMARLIREEMGKCYYREGVNHLEKCGKLRDRYLEQLKHAKVRGYLFEQQNYVPKS
ncbi:hypothetical protein LTR66_004737 [Elasticomyces elasticus]|nr:hypothetical protein LTR66_004737 [Elasticomyces elasticus]